MFLKLSRSLEDVGVASVRYDFSGSGESDGDFENVTLSGEVEEANVILDSVLEDPRIDRRRVSLLGLSMGGLVASLVAGHRLQDVHKLALLAPAGNMADIVLQTAKAVGADLSADYFDYAGNRVGRAFALDVIGLDVYLQAKHYDGPVLLLHGSQDAVVPAAVSEAYREKCYGDTATLKLIEGADHTFNHAAWEQTVITSVRDFLQP